MCLVPLPKPVKSILITSLEYELKTFLQTAIQNTATTFYVHGKTVVFEITPI